MPDTPIKELVTLDDLKVLLEENIELTKDTRRMLKRMRRDAIIGGVAKTVIWIVLILASFWLSAKFLEPYLGMLGGAESGIGDWQALLEQYRTQTGQ